MNAPTSTARSLALTAALLTALALTACGNKGDTPAASNDKTTKAADGADKAGGKASDAGGKTLNLAVAGDPETLDPGKMSGAPEGRVAFNVFEGLFMPAQTTGKPVYGVAEKHTVSEDGKTWTLNLRKDAKWSNGDPVTSKDFIYAWKRVLTPGFDADYAEFMDKIKGAAEYRGKKTEDWGEVGLQAPDDHTLVIELVNPTPYFDEMLAFYTFFPVHQKSIEAHGEDWTKPENYVTNGAYRMKEYQHQQHMVLEKNPNYWDKDKVKIDQVKIFIIKDNTATLNAFKEGKLDVMSGIPYGQIPALKGKPELRIDPMLGVYYYRVNVKANEALGKKAVREALALAIDRKALVQRSLKGVPQPADGFVPSMEGYQQRTKLEFNPDRARELMGEAGYPDGKGFPEVTLLFNTDENHKLVAELIQDMWKRELNVNIKLENKEWKTYLDSIDKQNYEIARAGWIGDYTDPETFLKIMTTGDGNNDTGWGNERYDALLKASAAEPDPKKHLEMLAQAEEILMSELPVIPIYYYRNPLLVSQRVQGFKAHNRDVHLVRYMDLK